MFLLCCRIFDSLSLSPQRVQDRRLLVIATTSRPGILRQLELDDAFGAIITVPQLTKPQQVQTSECRQPCFAGPAASTL
jgi:hypothetical protein